MSGGAERGREPTSSARRRRRAVGPTGARPPGEEPRLGLDEPAAPGVPDDEERLRRDRPPHHDQGV